MSRDYIQAQLAKVKTEFSEPQLDLAMCAAWIVGNFKGINIKVLDLRKKNAIADFFVICSVTNQTMAQSLGDELAFQFKAMGHQYLSYEGYDTAEWVLVDFGTVMIHIFQENSRDAYGIDEMFQSADKIKIPDSYYMSENNTGAALDEKSFF